MTEIIGLSVPFHKSDEDLNPAYYQLAKAIQEQIENGRLSVGQQIPPERKIAALNNLSMATVRKAIETLVQQNLLNRIQGKGTYIASTALRRKKIRYYPFVKDFHNSPYNTLVKFIGLRVVEGDKRRNRHLNAKTDQALYEMRRLLTTTGSDPLVYSVSYLPTNMFPNLQKYDRSDFEKHYLYLFLEDEFGISTIKNIELYGATLADEATANLLKVETGHPLLQVEMLALTHKKRPYEYRISYCLTDDQKIRRII